MKITSNYAVSIGSSTACCSSHDSVTLFEGLNETSITLKFSPQQLHCTCQKIDCIESGF
ncbi:MAG: hypothetical protein MUE44_13975 [Oscillatoriaceae cyanobacterium Prado104]|nr:hypothetical protein [Oscillatoriaceae cyanobacterium Prado104]